MSDKGEAAGCGEKSPDALRLDRLLVYLRFARTRSTAARLIETGALRRNRNRVRRASEKIVIGDVLTFATGKTVRVIKVLSLPERRGAPAVARSHYRELDPRAELPLAAPRIRIPGSAAPPHETKDAQ